MGKILSTMSGNVCKVFAEVGNQVEEGKEVVILESMKMEIPILVDVGGTIKEVKVREGDCVNEGDVLIELV